ncbi:MAG: accessory factor UbiK family protein [Gammaproteobacteria bacterium]|jgi:BMFP domain-containing protein YqiC|nr:accessory factor UbiK family protein [Gammaproteobacteria bacterium]MDP6731594.1 accessory factor UbiK family protein [Gammaproteobacteria bacterium]|tara:strand:+ start:352 stop:612 length:261 start_codon:yes stop_codon:yes gene_type:complete
MLDNSFLNDLSNRLAALLPAAENLRDETRTKIGQILRKAFADLDLLSREEFGVQAESLSRARKRIEKLESLIIELEKRLDSLAESR